VTADCLTLWIGDSLGPVERACLRSFARQGHKVALYCYDEPQGVPAEIDVRDASAIIPRAVISEPWIARADLYSDWFRYELLKRGLGTWVDADVYLVRPLDMEKPYLFGVQDAPIVNNALLRVPTDSPLLPELLEPFVRRTTPRWLPWHKYLPLRARELLTGQVDLTKVPWGTTSPYALTPLVRKHGLEHWAEPQERFYPVPWQRADWIADPGTALDQVITEGTVAIHLWNRCISQFKNDPAPAGSFLDRLQQEGA
jgi:alpha 1,4-glycosyltransferase